MAKKGEIAELDETIGIKKSNLDTVQTSLKETESSITTLSKSAINNIDSVADKAETSISKLDKDLTAKLNTVNESTLKFTKAHSELG